MMRQLIHKARAMFFQPGGAGAMHSLHYLRSEALEQQVMTSRMTAEQHRIRWLEMQNQQLEAEVARWKNLSICFAHDLRESLND